MLVTDRAQGMVRTYASVLDILNGAFGVSIARLRCLVDVPELDPPVKQEGVISHLIRRQLRRREFLVLAEWIGAVEAVVRAGLHRLAGGHFHARTLQHGARELEVLVPQEVVVDVCV